MPSAPAALCHGYNMRFDYMPPLPSFRFPVTRCPFNVFGSLLLAWVGVRTVLGLLPHVTCSGGNYPAARNRLFTSK